MSPARLQWSDVRRGLVFVPPVSKSDAIRCHLLRFARGESFPPFSRHDPDDVEDVRRALERFASDESDLTIELGFGAAPYRFLLALAAMSPGRRCTFTIPEPLLARPHGPLLESLERTLAPFGLAIRRRENGILVDAAHLRLPPALLFHVLPSSSQYLSAIALAVAAAIARGDCGEARIELGSAPESGGYAALTAQWIAEAGFEIALAARSWDIRGFEARPWEPAVPPDWSSAAYLAAWAWKSDGSVRIGPRGLHPDASIIEHLGKAGLSVQTADDTMRIQGALKHGFEADARVCPDLIPTLAMFALSSPEPSRFFGVSTLRSKESDRLEFIQTVASLAGGSTGMDGHDLLIHPAVYHRKGVQITTRHDHRRALAGSLLIAFDWKEIEIDEPSCVNKSFPLYWETIAACGAILEAQ